MLQALPDPYETAERGRAIYEQQIRPMMSEEDAGKFLVINIKTGQYEIDADRLTASDRAATKFPGAPLFGMRVGFQTSGRIGAGRPLEAR